MPGILRAWPIGNVEALSASSPAKVDQLSAQVKQPTNTTSKPDQPLGDLIQQAQEDKHSTNRHSASSMLLKAPSKAKKEISDSPDDISDSDSHSVQPIETDDTSSAGLMPALSEASTARLDRDPLGYLCYGEWLHLVSMTHA